MGGDGIRRLEYRPALDGARGIAILLVVAAHLRMPGFDGGGITGVTLFFALSGFLITSILIREQSNSGRISLGRFYARRALRLLPALLTFVVVVVLLGMATATDGLWALSYVGNWHLAGGGDLGSLDLTWSLAVEEQFYLLYPPALVLLRCRLPTFAVLVTGAAVGAVVLRSTIGILEGARIYFGSDTRADAILFGCSLAILLSCSGPHVRFRRHFVCIGALVLGVVTLMSEPAILFQYGYTLATLGSLLLIFGAAGASSGDRGLLCCRPLCWLGKVSYSLYLWHGPVKDWAMHQSAPWLLRVTVTVAISVVLAAASRRFIERPFLRLKSGLDALPKPAEASAGVVGLRSTAR